MSFRTISGIIYRERSERYVEPYRGIDTSMTKNYDGVAFACIVIRDRRWKVPACQSQTCAKIPKRHEILDPGDPGSGILQDFGSYIFILSRYLRGLGSKIP